MYNHTVAAYERWHEASFFFPWDFLYLNVIYIYKYNAKKPHPSQWFGYLCLDLDNWTMDNCPISDKWQPTRFDCHLSHIGQLSIVTPIKKPPKYSQCCPWIVRLRVRVFLLLLRLLSYLSSFFLCVFSTFTMKVVIL